MAKTKAKLIKAQRNRLDKLWSQLVRDKYNHTCIMCDKSKAKGDVIQAHHSIVTRAHSNATRWDTRNGVALCYSCHICKLHGSSDKTFIDQYVKKIDELIPIELQDEIRIKSNTVIIKNNDLDTIEAELKSMLE